MKNIDTRERILNEALKLFAKKGYDAVGVAEIADAVGIKAPSLYKHFKSKRDIFDSIIERVNKMDSEKARVYEMPNGTIDEIAEDYKNIPIEKIKKYSKAMLLHWTVEEFSSCFRKLLTLEQYKSEEMAELYRNYISCGPVKYMADIFADFTENYDEAYSLALEFYGPMYLLYSIYDANHDIDYVTHLLDEHIEKFNTLKERGKK